MGGVEVWGGFEGFVCGWGVFRSYIGFRWVRVDIKSLFSGLSGWLKIPTNRRLVNPGLCLDLHSKSLEEIKDIKFQEKKAESFKQISKPSFTKELVSPDRRCGPIHAGAVARVFSSSTPKQAGHLGTSSAF